MEREDAPQTPYSKGIVNTGRTFRVLPSSR